MDRHTVGSAGMALVGVLALALAAATLTSPVERRGGAGDAAGSGSGGNLGLGFPVPELPLLAFAPELLFLLVLLVSLVVVVFLLYGPSRPFAVDRRGDIDIDIEYRGGAVRLLVVLVILGLLALLLAALLSGSLFPGGSGSGAGTGQGGGGPQSESTSVVVPPLLVVAAVGLVVVTLLALGFGGRLRTRNASGPTTTDGTDEDPDPETVARAAGDAADRIEAGGAVENEVYRAWREMTELLAVPSPETRTPGEFADAAVEAGMAPDDVAELTELFEAVRYGDADPTPETERRARAVFRRIETTYGDGP